MGCPKPWRKRPMTRRSETAMSATAHVGIVIGTDRATVTDRIGSAVIVTDRIGNAVIVIDRIGNVVIVTDRTANGIVRHARIATAIGLDHASATVDRRAT